MAKDGAKDDILQAEFMAAPDLVRLHALRRPRHPALILEDGQDGRTMDYATLDALMDRIAAALQRDGVAARDAVAICAPASLEYAVLYWGILRAGAVVAPLSPSASAESIDAMVRDSGAKLFFTEEKLRSLGKWLAPPRAVPQRVEIKPEWAFNIIYSSGTTGTPKGIVQPHAMRWAHIRRAAALGYGPEAVTLLSTPLYSNTTLVSFLPAVALGGTAVLMRKFDVAAYLELAQRHRATHTILVPVQYQRFMAFPEFDRYDLSAFRMKRCTSAPFAAALKAEVVRRWPGRLIDSYGLTEGGGVCTLDCTAHPDKLHTVGVPSPGHDIRLIDEDGREVPRGEAGEIVGHSPGMMTGYQNQDELTRAAEWRDASGKRFIRTGDIGRFDEDGFMLIIDRKKDMIISGGFNVYPSDLEAVLRQHPDVAEASVVGVPSLRWGETPVAFVVSRSGSNPDLLGWANERLGRTQRIAAIEFVAALPRSPIGKVLKRELRERIPGPMA